MISKPVIITAGRTAQGSTGLDRKQVLRAIAAKFRAAKTDEEVADALAAALELAKD